jgi:transketolase
MRKKRNKIDEINRLKELTRMCRQDVLKMVMFSGEGHLGGGFSSMEILTALYFSVMNIDPLRPDWEDRDLFIMSKGHACFALYAVLARRGFFPIDLLDSVKQSGTILGGHPDRDQVPGIDATTGSLGHGLSVAAGMGLAAKRDGKSKRIFVLMGDGECQEGSVWEAVMFAAANSLDNLVAIVDSNGLQAIGKTVDIIPMEPFAEKWKAFGWGVGEVDGHNCGELLDKLTHIPIKPGRPTVIIARTIKGKGVSFMENEIMWHARATTEEEFERAIFEFEHLN